MTTALSFIALVVACVAVFYAARLQSTNALGSRPGFIEAHRLRANCRHHHQEGWVGRNYMRCITCRKRVPIVKVSR